MKTRNNKGQFIATQRDNPIKYCRVCKDQLIPDDNWLESQEETGNYICKDCHNIAVRKVDAKRKGTPKRIASHRKSNRKHSNKQRGLGDTELFDNPFDELVDWHHVSDEFIVAVPRDLHELYNRYDLQEHRELCMNVINQIYI